MIDYAAGDTSHLLALRDEIETKLVELGRIEWAREEFANLTRVRWDTEEDQAPKFLKMKGIRGFAPAALGILKVVFEWREKEAMGRDKPPFRILTNQALLEIAKANPSSTQELLDAGVPTNSVKRYGRALVTAARTGSKEPYEETKSTKARKRIPPAEDGVVDALKELRNRISKQLGIEPGVLCPNRTLQAIARATPKTQDQLGDISELRSWQTDALGGNRIIELVNK